MARQHLAAAQLRGRHLGMPMQWDTLRLHDAPMKEGGLALSHELLQRMLA